MSAKKIYPQKVNLSGAAFFLKNFIPLIIIVPETFSNPHAFVDKQYKYVRINAVACVKIFVFLFLKKFQKKLALSTALWLGKNPVNKNFFFLFFYRYSFSCPNKILFYTPCEELNFEQSLFLTRI